MLLGTYTPKLDEKGRIIVPAKFRKELGDGLVVTRGQERCLYVFSEEEFARMHDRIREAPITSKQSRDYLRLFLSGAHAEEPDKQNRISIPANLREYAGLEKELVVIGAGSRAEIWNETSWNEYLAEQESAFADISEEVIPGML